MSWRGWRVGRFKPQERLTNFQRTSLQRGRAPFGDGVLKVSSEKELKPIGQHCLAMASVQLTILLLTVVSDRFRLQIQSVAAPSKHRLQVRYPATRIKYRLLSPQYY